MRKTKLKVCAESERKKDELGFPAVQFFSFEVYRQFKQKHIPRNLFIYINKHTYTHLYTCQQERKKKTHTHYTVSIFVHFVLVCNGGIINHIVYRNDVKRIFN